MTAQHYEAPKYLQFALDSESTGKLIWERNSFLTIDDLEDGCRVEVFNSREKPFGEATVCFHRDVATIIFDDFVQFGYTPAKKCIMFDKKESGWKFKRL